MGGGDYTEWAAHFYPVFNREGLIIDVRHNRGGNIDSWILEKLLRQAWFFWQPPVGSPTWNMQYAFRGHVVVLVRRVHRLRRRGVRRGLPAARPRQGDRHAHLGRRDLALLEQRPGRQRHRHAAETGVYGPEGQWLIEGHGVDPDIVVDNLPHATFDGEDAQLEAAVEHLLGEIAEDPVPCRRPPRIPTSRSATPSGRRLDEAR